MVAGWAGACKGSFIAVVEESVDTSYGGAGCKQGDMVGLLADGSVPRIKGLSSAETGFFDKLAVFRRVNSLQILDGNRIGLQPIELGCNVGVAQCLGNQPRTLRTLRMVRSGVVQFKIWVVNNSGPAHYEIEYSVYLGISQSHRKLA